MDLWQNLRFRKLGCLCEAARFSGVDLLAVRRFQIVGGLGDPVCLSCMLEVPRLGASVLPGGELALLQMLALYRQLSRKAIQGENMQYIYS